jgi:hypothetical protein
MQGLGDKPSLVDGLCHYRAASARRDDCLGQDRAVLSSARELAFRTVR